MKLNELALNTKIIVGWVGVSELTKKSNGQKFKKATFLMGDSFVDIPSFQTEMAEKLLRISNIYDAIKSDKVYIKVFESTRKSDSMKYRYIRVFYTTDENELYIFNDKTGCFDEVAKKPEQMQLPLSKKSKKAAKKEADELPF